MHNTSIKSSLLLFLLIISCPSIVGQKLPEWYRVYTFEDSIIEMNTSNVILGGDIGRVTFRWTFDQPEVLKDDPRLRYQTRLETIEFKCSENRYRLFEVTFLDPAGKMLHSALMSPPYDWSPVRWGSVKGKIFGPACELIQKKLGLAISDEQVELDKVAKFALSFSQRLRQARDFKPILEEYFATDYLEGYLRDDDANRFLNLSRDTAAKASRSELQRFYVAFLNTGYLSSLYLISESPSEFIPDEKRIPPDIYGLIKHHPYTATYKGNQESYDYLAENIDSIERLRSYTDLMERVAALMRKHLIRVDAEQSKGLQDTSEYWDLFEPKIRTCSRECLGLPKGTRLFEVNVPILHLQIADMNGKLKVVSARALFQ